MQYPSREDYLKSIYLLHQKNGEVRECEIAEYMGYSKASVCNMVKNLEKQGYVTVQCNDVRLTDCGRRCATEVYRKYLTVTLILMTVLGIDEDRAREEACRMEHVISQETVEALEGILKERGVIFYDSSVGKAIYQEMG